MRISRGVRHSTRLRRVGPHRFVVPFHCTGSGTNVGARRPDGQEVPVIGSDADLPLPISAAAVVRDPGGDPVLNASLFPRHDRTNRPLGPRTDSGAALSEVRPAVRHRCHVGPADPPRPPGRRPQPPAHPTSHVRYDMVRVDQTPVGHPRERCPRCAPPRTLAFHHAVRRTAPRLTGRSGQGPFGHPLSIGG